MTSGALALAALPAPLRDLVHRAARGLPARAERLRGRDARHRALGRFLRDATLVRWAGAEVDDLDVVRHDAMAHLLSLQSASGTFRSGDNVDSPPDSAFTVNDLALTRRLVEDPALGLGTLRAGLDEVLDAATPALVGGGVHTPTHRWEISSALVRLWQLNGRAEARARAEQWLAEGIDLQRDGMFSERSANYAAHVSIPSLLTLARVLGRQDLRAAADAATVTQARLTAPDGTIETLASRRQDQGTPFDGGALLPLFHAHAVRSGHAVTARAASRTLPRADADAALTLLAIVAEDPSASGPLPRRAPDPSPRSPEVVELRDSGLAVVDHGTSRAVIHGGTDAAALGRVASGSSANPTLLRFAAAGITISDVRLSRDFFALGPLRPTAPVPEPSRPGNVAYRLHEEVSGEYFHPLPGGRRSPGGSYPLEYNGRFAAAMDFPSRATDEVVLGTTTDVEVSAGTLHVRLRFVGPRTAMCLLLALDAEQVVAIDGRLTTSSSDHGRRDILLASSEGGDTAVAEASGADGAGLRLTLHGALGGPAFYAPGEAYTFLGGTDEPVGPALLVPASSDAELTLTIERTSR